MDDPDLSDDNNYRMQNYDGRSNQTPGGFSVDEYSKTLDPNSPMTNKDPEK